MANKCQNIPVTLFVLNFPWSARRVPNMFVPQTLFVLAICCETELHCWHSFVTTLVLIECACLASLRSSPLLTPELTPPLLTSLSGYVKLQHCQRLPHCRRSTAQEDFLQSVLWRCHCHRVHQHWQTHRLFNSLVTGGPTQLNASIQTHARGGTVQLTLPPPSSNMKSTPFDWSTASLTLFCSSFCR